MGAISGGEAVVAAEMSGERELLLVEEPRRICLLGWLGLYLYSSALGDDATLAQPDDAMPTSSPP